MNRFCEKNDLHWLSSIYFWSVTGAYTFKTLFCSRLDKTLIRLFSLSVHAELLICCRLVSPLAIPDPDMTYGFVNGLPQQR